MKISIGDESSQKNKKESEGSWDRHFYKENYLIDRFVFQLPFQLTKCVSQCHRYDGQIHMTRSLITKKDKQARLRKQKFRSRLRFVMMGNSHKTWQNVYYWHPADPTHLISGHGPSCTHYSRPRLLN